VHDPSLAHLGVIRHRFSSLTPPFPLGVAAWSGRLRFLEGARHGRKAEVVEHDTVTDEYIVCAGLGRSSDWYRNLVARPALRVQVGNRSWEPRQRLLDVTEAADRFARYEHRHPRTAKRLLAWMGRSYDGSDAGRLAMMDEMPMVAFGRR
jgi:deazaflavin-dependent oxidoreductase (nitroreductase family)